MAAAFDQRSEAAVAVRIIHDLLQVADVPNTIITHDAGSPRDEPSAFWNPIAPLTYSG
jgi:hypothetical protein